MTSGDNNDDDNNDYDDDDEEEEEEGEEEEDDDDKARVNGKLLVDAGLQLESTRLTYRVQGCKA